MTVIAFTRPERRLKESIKAAEAAGFTVMAAPSLEIIPCSIQDMEQLFRTISENDVVVFTSPTSAEECGRSPIFKDSMRDAHILSIGPGTAKALERLGVATDTMPSEYSSEGIVEHLHGSVKGKKIILIRSDHGSRVLDEGLRAMGAEVVDFIAYSLKPVDPKHLNKILDAGRLGKVDVFAFTSPLSASSFVEAAEKRGIDAKDMFKRSKVAAIGKPTTDMLASLGIWADIVPVKATFEEMIAAIKKMTEM
ncbi:uroporphyrinogen-III synthase [Candidatus Methanoplasma termitum]|uniref:Uroporphyrinogen-III synthase n=1 Tax=Candidatus Methanoplasma termitum TaxID=1577791 RepID=A0A0A7LE96_9ARCH|nr:uroporphyrinogen-III synthase [Candidatus Methanoplasma termitum]AIZ56587.1 uroporphyrinogen-III synthase [Candidatus Methanoplasma termitum]MCL2333834.1 uroporphyrinogen-III synthase [Candidatus Methanoplasma sp.]